MTFNRVRPPASTPGEQPLKHVIEEYRHQAQRVTCVCGWEGSTAEVMGERSPWASHVRQFKAGKR
jgi:hypothetical protein